MLITPGHARITVAIIITKTHFVLGKSQEMLLKYINLCYVYVCLSRKNIYSFMFLLKLFLFIQTSIKFAEEPCTSGTTPIVSHCPTIVGERSRSGVNVLRAMNKSNISGESTSSESLNRVEVHHQPCN